ncbi:MAG: hypothetical protein AAF617_08300 [Bacteroidota bacterium]
MRKKVVAITAVSLLCMGCYSIKKYQAAVVILKQLTVLPTNIKDVKVTFDKIRFTFDLQLTNHTQYDIGFTTGSVIEITRIQLFTQDGVLLADINTDISAIELPAYGRYTIENIAVVIPTVTMLNELDMILSYITQNNLQYELTMKAFGKEFKMMT